MQDITVKELKERMDKGETLIVIDVREPWEYEEFNIGGQLVPLGELPSMVDDWDEWQNKEIIVHCKSGGRSGAAKGFLMQNGFTTVRNLIGGIEAWKAEFLSS